MPEPIRVLVVGPKYSSSNSRGGMATVVAMMRASRDDRVRITTVATFVDDPTIARFVTGVTGVLRAAVLLLARRADVLHVHLAHRGSVVRKAVPLLTARLLGVPAVVHAHSYDFVGWFDALSPWVQTLVRRALPAARWLVLGDVLAEQYATRLHLPPERVGVLRNPAEAPDRASVRSARAGVQAVFLGRLGQRKGSYDVVRAVALLSAQTRSMLTVVLAGDGEVEQVRLAVLAAGVVQTVDVRSWLQPAERDSLLAASDIFVLPSYDEGLPMALLEAMAWGLVPVTTPVGAIAEVVEDGRHGVLIAPGDVPALAQALERLVNDPAYRAELGAAAATRSADFASGRWFDALIAEWTALLRTSP